MRLWRPPLVSTIPMTARSARSGRVGYRRRRRPPALISPLGAEGGAAVAVDFGRSDIEVGGVAAGDTDGGELALLDVLLDGGGAQAEGGGGVPIGSARCPAQWSRRRSWASFPRLHKGHGLPPAPSGPVTPATRRRGLCGWRNAGGRPKDARGINPSPGRGRGRRGRRTWRRGQGKRAGARRG